jgi:WD40 repeat protein
MRRFFTIPDEIMIYVFSLISDIHDLNRCSLTCKRWNRILRENAIWKTACRKNGFTGQVIRNHRVWNRLFKYYYITQRNWKKGRFSIRHFKQIIDPNNPSGLCAAFDDKWVISLNFGGGDQGKVWNYHTGEEKIRISGHSAAVSCVHFNRKFIATGSADSTIKLWNWSGDCLHTFQGHEKEITCLYVTNDTIISGSEDQTIKIWNIATTQCDSTLAWHDDSIICLTFYGAKIVAGSADKNLSIWNFDTKTLDKILVGHTGSVHCVSANSEFIVSGSEDTTLRIWNFDGACLKILSGHTSLVICLLIDKEKVISGSADTSIKVWDIKSGYCMYTLKNHSSPVWNLYATSNSLISSAFDQSLIEHDFSHVEQEDS